MSQIIVTQGGALTASSLGTVVQDSRGAAGAFGAYTELIASTDYDAIGVYLGSRPGGAYWNYELGIGAASSEVSVGACCCAAGGNGMQFFYVPAFIPAGSRLAVRGGTAGSYAADSTAVGYLVRAQPGQLRKSHRGTLGGVTTGAWTTLDGGATANTKSGYTQLVSSTSRDAKGYSLFFATPSSQTSNTTYLVDFAIGAAASEVIILPNIYNVSKGYDYFAAPAVVGPIWTPIPAGSRLSMNLQCSSNTAADRKLQVAIILWE